MVDPDSDRVPRAPPYSGFCYESKCFGYAAFTLFDAPSQKLLLHFDLLPTQYRSPTTPLLWFGLFPVRSPLLRESLLISFPGLLRWFTSPGVTHASYFIQMFMYQYTGGLPHSVICGYNGYVLLTAAFRSLSRPSSPYSSTGIRHRPIIA